MSPLDEKIPGRPGVWKSGRGKGRKTPKGRQLDDAALAEVLELLGDRPRRRDLLIEHLHLIQDTYGHLSAAHLRALGEEMKMAQAEVYEVATFYAHFDVVKEGETAPPDITIRVCDSLSCELAGAQELMAKLAAKYNGGREVRVLRAPCMGRCDTAPTLEIGHNHIDHATPESVAEAIAAKDFHPKIPVYETYQEYAGDGGYQTLKYLRGGARTPDEVQQAMLDSGLRGLGGAGFPAGRKWSFVRAAEGTKYLAVNGDEGEPGTFKDRYYLEREPHVFLEGMLIAAWAVEAETCFIYMRDEYPAVLEILATEIAELEKAGIFDPGHID
ncbi:MAG: NAD(P)H-dependent oxidoreductase subunit E, partial [Proteobacteria bacterium]|nr:NAD(P)H-dependent oxidoreductase subunit E [Pseudomonadota bacterium]